jgi:hypothetical protein
VGNYALNDTSTIIRQCYVIDRDFEWEICHIMDDKESLTGTFGQHNTTKNIKIMFW